MSQPSQPPQPVLPATPLHRASSEPSLILAPESLIVLSANPAFIDTLGLKEREVIGRSILQWIHTEQREDFNRTIRMVDRYPSPIEIPFSWSCPSRGRIELKVTAWTVRLSSHTQVIELTAVPTERSEHFAEQCENFDAKRSVG